MLRQIESFVAHPRATLSGLCVLAIIFCGFESVPGWNSFHTSQSYATYLLIAILAGLIIGIVNGQRYWLPGLLGGSLGGLGCFYAISLLLQILAAIGFPFIQYGIVIIVGAVGTLPGWGLFVLLKSLQDRITRKPKERLSPQEPIPERAWPKALRRPLNDPDRKGDILDS